MGDLKPELKVRHIDFQFPDDIEFQWNPGNPYWGNFVNYATLIAPAFERYFIRATRDAMPAIRDPRIANEADLFCKQEGQHSKHHLAHLKMLVQKYPGLDDVRRQVAESYEKLYQEESQSFHLAYAAVIELCFGPFASFIVENRDKLFIDSDPRIASFIMWHMVEEFEHRNSAIDIFNHVVDSYWVRLRTIPRVFHHLFQIDAICRQGLKDHAPVVAGEVGPSESIPFLKDIPKTSLASLVYHLCCTFLPYHNPNNIKQPEWVSQWFRDEASGMDMRDYYPSVAP
ncbi:Uncharacterised protein [BD1-7 clade bacterium]|uniref:Metal-dependent hydrolase n=1 Tax=BD1-7 clade bacterium TaxID=2029982 RepID=A0A5S9N1C0_9GAMM|nr:Uncharacterised protein [BD1-7 clade bacterium]